VGRTSVSDCSVEGGPDEQALAALEARDFGSLNRLVPEPVDERLQLRDDLDVALARLREIRDRYWDHNWRREHRGYGRYPEEQLVVEVRAGTDLAEIAERHGRTRGGIKSRLIRMIPDGEDVPDSEQLAWISARLRDDPGFD